MIGQVLGHYRITHPIERGGMATVYRATDIHLQREVAIKIFQIANDEITTKSFFQRFLREAQVVASLDHPNILLVHDYGEENGLAYLVMPYLAQGSLKQMLQRRRVVPVLEALDLHLC
jgi:serine/threonine protein kinase